MLPSINSIEERAVRPKLTVEPVPADLAIAPDRWRLICHQGDRLWIYPLQLTGLEIHHFTPRLQQLNWMLDAQGVPVELEAIHAAVERLVDEDFRHGKFFNHTEMGRMLLKRGGRAV